MGVVGGGWIEGIREGGLMTLELIMGSKGLKYIRVDLIDGFRKRRGRLSGMRWKDSRGI